MHKQVGLLLVGVFIGLALHAPAQAAAAPITEYPVPTAGLPGLGSEPDGIAAGPDGAIWFTEAIGNKIGRISVVPTSKEQCKNGGWRTFPGFRNQGDCVAFVATHGRNHPTGG